MSPGTISAWGDGPSPVELSTVNLLHPVRYRVVEHDFLRKSRGPPDPIHVVFQDVVLVVMTLSNNRLDNFALCCSDRVFHDSCEGPVHTTIKKNWLYYRRKQPESFGNIVMFVL